MISHRPRRKKKTWATFRLVRETSHNAPSFLADKRSRVDVRQPHDIANFLYNFMENELTEAMYVIPLNAQYQIITKGPIVVSRGTVEASLANPRDVFAAAISAMASYIIVAHNHPSGIPAPSMADKEITARLVQAGELMDIPVLDHLIIGTSYAENNWFSFAQNGLISRVSNC